MIPREQRRWDYAFLVWTPILVAARYFLMSIMSCDKKVYISNLRHPKEQLSNNPLESNCRMNTPLHRLDLAILFQSQQGTGHLFLVETGMF